MNRRVAVAFHWNGSSWIETFPNALDSYYLSGVWTDASAGVWAINDNEIARWTGSLPDNASNLSDGGAPSDAAPSIEDARATGCSPDDWCWVWATPETISEPYLSLTSIRGAAPGDIWSVGSAGVLHWDGATWSSVPIRLVAKLTSPDVWISGPNDVWAAEADDVLRWDGSSWTATSLCAADLSGSYFDRLWGASPDDVWAFSGAPEGQTVHWNGSAWQTDVSIRPSSTRLGEARATTSGRQVTTACSITGMAPRGRAWIIRTSRSSEACGEMRRPTYGPWATTFRVRRRAVSFTGTVRSGRRLKRERRKA